MKRQNTIGMQPASSRQRTTRHPLHPPTVRAAAGIPDRFAGVVDHFLEELAIGRRELITPLGLVAIGKHGLGVEVVLDVSATALYQEPRQLTAITLVVRAGEIRRQLTQRRMQDFQKGAERRFVATVGRGRHQDNMPLLVLSNSRHELVPLLSRTAFIARRARVGLVDDYELRAGAREVLSAAVALDVVQRHNRKTNSLE